MKPRLLFVPGWALDGALWDGVLAMLDATGAGPSCCVFEPGYFSARPDPCRLDGPTIAIGHSLGLMQLLMTPPSGLCGLVSINGFTRFSQAPDHPEGIAPRWLRRMRQRVDEDAGAVALAFRRRCGLDRPLPGAAQPARLRSGLDLLETGDCRAMAASAGLPIRVLAGGRDAIATPALTGACFDDPQWVTDGGHLLPVTHPRDCAQTVLAMLATLS